jgi:hypothetical protein
MATIAITKATAATPIIIVESAVTAAELESLFVFDDAASMPMAVAAFEAQ